MLPAGTRGTWSSGRVPELRSTGASAAGEWWWQPARIRAAARHEESDREVTGGPHTFGLARGQRAKKVSPRRTQATFADPNRQWLARPVSGPAKGILAMKTFSSLLLGIAVVSGLVGCGRQTETERESSGVES